MKNFYKILGVHSNATNADIWAAYKRLSVMFHPVVNKSKGAHGKFKEITEAYETLIHPPSRISYDIALKIFEENNRPKERTVVYDNIPYLTGVPGTKVEPVKQLPEPKEESFEVSVAKFLFWTAFLALSFMFHQK